MKEWRIVVYFEIVQETLGFVTSDELSLKVKITICYAVELIPGLHVIIMLFLHQ
jgi:hypothetical protein